MATPPRHVLPLVTPGVRKVRLDASLLDILTSNLVSHNREVKRTKTSAALTGSRRANQTCVVIVCASGSTWA